METRPVDIHTHRPTGRAVEPCAVGIHPWDAARTDPETIRSRIADAPIVGEIGLDFLRPDRERQQEVFLLQLQWAEAACKPVLLHCVRAFEPAMALLARFRLPAVIFHGFIGSVQQAARAVAAGYYLSFGVRSLASSRTVAAMRSIPADRLFFETDDDPTPIESVYGQAARLLGMPAGMLVGIVRDNYTHLFG